MGDLEFSNDSLSDKKTLAQAVLLVRMFVLQILLRLALRGKLTFPAC